MNGITELANMFKERENVPYMGPQTGTVISPPPEIKVRLGDNIILDKSHLIIAAHVLADYQRTVAIHDASGFTGETVDALVGGAYQHNHAYDSLGFTGQLQYKNTLKIGDEVILVPSTDIQTYFLVDKAVRLK